MRRNRCTAAGVEWVLVVSWVFCLSLASAQAQESEFPGRLIYKTVNTIEVEELHSRLAQVHVVDVRSAYEYETLHIKGAIHIPLNDPGFNEKIRALKAADDKPVVFYCNGKTCYKSYKAADKAVGARIPEVYSYDAGIFDWAKAHPDQAVLLGRTLMDPNRLISTGKFKAHQLAPEEFGTRVHSTNAKVLDVREPMQRAGISLFPDRQDSIALDNAVKLKRYLDQVRDQGQTLLIYDEAGKQVRWFQYYLEDQGITNYYFMRGGVKAFYKEVLMAGG